MRKNLFTGRKGLFPKFAWLSYQRLISGEWFSLADVMADKMKLSSKDELPFSVSKFPEYGELKKAFKAVRDEIRKRLNGKYILSKRENKEMLFRFDNPLEYDPLEDLINADTVLKLQDYVQFCFDSAGFFPISWLEDFFEDSMDLLNIRQTREAGLSGIVSSLDRELRNIEWLPTIYRSIRDKKVLEVEYQPYGSEKRMIIFHPHLLKEFNGRWFLFGFDEGMPTGKVSNLALDRIQCIPRELSEHIYKAPEDGFYLDYFKDIVGVSKNGREVMDVIIRAHYLKMFNLMASKKLHHSQEIVKDFGEYNGREYGDFKVHLEINNEFIGRILQMGPGLEIVSPHSARNLFARKVMQMANLYMENDSLF